MSSSKIVKSYQVRQNWNVLCVGCYDRDVSSVLVNDAGVLYQSGSSFVVQDPFGLIREVFINSPVSAWYDVKILDIENLVIHEDCGTYVDIRELAQVTKKRTAVFVVPSSSSPLKNELVYTQLFQMITSQYSWYAKQMYQPVTFFITSDMDSNILQVIAKNSSFFQQFGMAYVALFPTFKKMRNRIGTDNVSLVYGAGTIAYFNKTEESETTMLLDFAVPYTYQNGHRIVRRQSG